jgi:serine/threonine-protein kinase
MAVFLMQPQSPDDSLRHGNTVSEETVAASAPSGCACPNGHPVAAGTTLCPMCGTIVGNVAIPLATPALPNVPGYEILKELGRGGMGVVYQARHLRLNRMVALKMMLDGDFASTEVRERFQREAEAVARLQHPNIVQIFEIGDTRGKPFFSLEYVEGTTLAERLRGGPMPPKEAARVVMVLASAVQCAHEQGIIHRDLKPANLLIAGAASLPVNQWAPKIADFGLAKHLNENAQKTLPSAVLGTPSYMAPEQVSSSFGTIGPATDIYALGAVLFELVTGRPPFQGPSVRDVLTRVETQEPISPGALQGGVDAELSTICLKCLEKKPANRYASAAALADDLDRYLTGRPILAKPIGWLRRSWKWVRLRPGIALFLLGLTLSLLGGTIVSTWFALEAQAARRLADRRLLDAQAAQRLADHRLYVSNLRYMPHAWDQGQLDWQTDLLDSVKPNVTGNV